MTLKKDLSEDFLEFEILLKNCQPEKVPPTLLKYPDDKRKQHEYLKRLVRESSDKVMEHLNGDAEVLFSMYSKTSYNLVDALQYRGRFNKIYNSCVRDTISARNEFIRYAKENNLNIGV